MSVAGQRFMNENVHLCLVLQGFERLVMEDFKGNEEFDLLTRVVLRIADVRLRVLSTMGELITSEEFQIISNSIGVDILKYGKESIHFIGKFGNDHRVQLGPHARQQGDVRKHPKLLPKFEFGRALPKSLDFAKAKREESRCRLYRRRF